MVNFVDNRAVNLEEVDNVIEQQDPGAEEDPDEPTEQEIDEDIYNRIMNSISLIWPEFDQNEGTINLEGF